jgi:hypothetical protein
MARLLTAEPRDDAHPMTRLMRAAAEGTPGTPVRRGGRAGRFRRAP